jgi:uncharacterized membrane protein YhhN
MIWSAILSRSRGAAAGAILFILSDSLLAWNMFVTPILWAGHGVMILYYAAQFLIAKSIEPSPAQATKSAKSTAAP